MSEVGGALRRTLSAHDDWVRCVALSAGGELLASVLPVFAN